MIRLLEKIKEKSSGKTMKKKKICTGLRNDGKTEKIGRKSRNLETLFVIGTMYVSIKYKIFAMKLLFDNV